MTEGATHGVEKDQVSRLQFIASDGLCAASLLVCATREQLSETFFVEMPDKSAAVKPGVGRFTTAPVRYTDQLQGSCDQVCGTLSDALSGLGQMSQDLCFEARILHSRGFDIGRRSPGRARHEGPGQATDANRSAEERAHGQEWASLNHARRSLRQSDAFEGALPC